ncbi:MAG TPA: nuclear transport factor 2 family protein [Caulobacteraceae bacterium]|nr:nuclear transport factor 2 family protein [Caulobacteraceae bacterium]
MFASKSPLRAAAILASAICLAASVGLPTMAVAQSALAAPSQAETGLLAAEDQRFAAEVAHDADAVGRAMADELTYTHASGQIQHKADYVEAIRSGKAAYQSIVASDRVARVSGAMGMVHGVLNMVVGDHHLASTYLAIYHYRDGRWQLLFWQTSPGPQAPGAGPRGPGAPGGAK